MLYPNEWDQLERMRLRELQKLYDSQVEYFGIESDEEEQDDGNS